MKNSYAKDSGFVDVKLDHIFTNNLFTIPLFRNEHSVLDQSLKSEFYEMCTSVILCIFQVFVTLILIKYSYF